jgi:glycosyltransferase involved in cell wall biosynthesis
MTRLDGISILHIIKGIDIGGKNGGAENFGIHLVQALRKQGVKVSLCAYLKHDTPIEKYWLSQLENDGIEVFFACPSQRMNFLKARKNIKNWLHDNHPNIVHSHYQIGTITLISLKLGTSINLLVRTAHVSLEFGRGIYGVISRFIFRDIFYPLFVDYEIGVSRSITHSLNQQFVRRLIHKHVLWIPNAIPDTNDIERTGDPLSTLNIGKSEKQWLIISIGILVSRKNINLLLFAMPEVLKQIPHAKLIIVGDGPELKHLLDLSNELGISKSCLFLGQQQNIHSILAISNLLILPSSSEGISTVLLEAIQNKVPVIASDIAGNRELIEENVSGWLIPVGDVGSISGAIIRAYHEPDKIKSMAENAHTQINVYYISNVCNKYINAYLSMMKNS